MSKKWPTFPKNIEKDAIAKLKENYHTHLKGILPSVDYLRYIERTLKEIYGEGIVSTENIQELHKDSTSAIMIATFMSAMTNTFRAGRSSAMRKGSTPPVNTR